MIKFIKRKRKKRSILWNWGNHVVSTWHQANRMVLYYRTNGFSLKTIFFHHLLIIFLLFFRLTSRRGITTTLLTNMTMFIEFHGPCWVAWQQNEKDVFTVTIMLFVVDTFPRVADFFFFFWGGFVRELNAI